MQDDYIEKRNFFIFLFALAVVIAVVVILVINKNQRVGSDPEGFFDIYFTNDEYKNKYKGYFASAASFWGDKVFPDFRISLDVEIYNDPDTQVLASASPRLGSDNRARSGKIKVNAAIFDEQNSATKINCIKHEMGHILGVGYWHYTSSGGNGPRLVGHIYPTALAEYNTLTGLNFTTGVPLESDGGNGTAGSHWENNSRSNFEGSTTSTGLYNELMTYGVSSVAPLSSVTLGYLKDNGWKVDMTKNQDSSLIYQTTDANSSLNTIVKKPQCGNCMNC